MSSGFHITVSSIALEFIVVGGGESTAPSAGAGIRYYARMAVACSICHIRTMICILDIAPRLS